MLNVYLAEFLSLLLIVAAIAVIRQQNLFVAVILLSVYSALISVIFSFLGAVDVSFTEAVVGTGVSTVLLMALIWRIDPTNVVRANLIRRVAGAAVALFVFSGLLCLINALPRFGDPAAPGQMHIAPDYVAGSLPLMQTPNVVTAVLADFRSFDTLIETAVVLTGALACLLILGKRDDKAV